jgi:hypothetical protein
MTEATTRGRSDASPVRNVTIGSLIVNNSRTTKKIVGFAILSAAIVGGTAAYAYPPGQATMTASVASVPKDTGGSDITVTVSHSNPGCNIKLDVNEQEITVPAGHGETFTQVIHINAERGRHSVTVKTVGCAGLNKESTKASFALLKPHIDTKSSIKHGSSFTVTVKDFPPNTAFTVVPTGPAGSTAPAPWNGTTDSKGLGKVKISLPSAGSWSIVASSGGTSASANIDVR